MLKMINNESGVKNGCSKIVSANLYDLTSYKLPQHTRYKKIYEELQPLYVLRPLVKAYLKVIVNSKKDIDIIGRLKTLKKYLEQKKPQAEKNNDEKLADWFLSEIKNGLSASNYQELLYFESLVSQKESFLKFNKIIEKGKKESVKIKLTIDKKDDSLYVIDRLFLKTVKFILNFNKNCENCFDNKQVNLEKDSLDIFYSNVISLLTIDESNFKALQDNIKGMNGKLNEIYSDDYSEKYILVKANLLASLNNNETNKDILAKIERVNEINEKLEDDILKVKNLIKEIAPLITLKKLITDNKDKFKIIKNGVNDEVISNDKKLLEKYNLYIEKLKYLKMQYNELSKNFNEYKEQTENKNNELVAIKNYINLEQKKYDNNEILNILTRKLVNRMLLMLRKDEGGKKNEGSIITTLINLKDKGVADKLMLSILNKNKEEIVEYATSPCRKSLSGMYALSCEIPNMKRVKYLYNWCKDHIIDKDGNIDEEEAQRLLSSITGMQHGEGMPDINKLNTLYTWCEEKSDEPKRLLSSITGMQMGLGIPDINKLNTLYTWCEEKSNEPKRLLSSITGMQMGLGIEETVKYLDKIEKLINYCKKVNPNNYLDELSKYTGKQSGILQTNKMLGKE